MLKMVLKNKWSVYINKSIENLKFPMIWLDYYLGQTLIFNRLGINKYIFLSLLFFACGTQNTVNFKKLQVNDFRVEILS